MPIALLKQIACCFRGTPKGVFRMRLLPGLKLVASFLKFQLVEEVKAGVKFGTRKASIVVCPAAGSVARTSRTAASRAPHKNKQISDKRLPRS